MPYPLNLPDGVFVADLQEAVYDGGMQISVIAQKFRVEESRVVDWLNGQDLPPNVTQHAILTWLEEEAE